jgi:alpha-glucoside transport system substrate-binding protein
VVEIFGPIVDGPGERLGEALRLASVDAPVELRYVGVTSFNEQLADRLDRGDRPDVALLPQPGVLTDLARRGVSQPLSAEVAATSRDSYPAALVDLVAVDGQPAAVWLTVDVKGLVWYSPSVFTDRGLRIPTTLDELDELSDAVRTADDGVAPWCLTTEAGAATGWVGTDWVEGYALRRLGPEDYDRWTAGDLPFDSPQITTTFEELDGLLRAPGAVSGGSRAILTTPWERAADGLLADPPRCLMAYQADFLRRHLPSDTDVGPDGDLDFFVLPSTDERPPPLLIGGTLAAPLRDSETVDEAMSILASTELAELLDGTDDFLSPHLGVPRSSVSDDTSGRLLELLAEAPDVRFDGSDLMPAEVGTGTFWSGMNSFFSGEALDAVLADIETGWPEPDEPPPS